MNSSASWKAAAFLALLCSSVSPCQNLDSVEGLPDAPGVTMQAAPPPTSSEPQGTAQINGVVEDVQGSPVPQATVVLAAPGKLGNRSVSAGSDGSFAFTSVRSGPYRLIVQAPGLATFTTGEFVLKAGETLQAPKIAMKITTSMSVNVVASPDEVAAEEVHEQEQQRVLGVFQNFYTSYIWNAAPMPANQKYKLAFHALGDPFQFLVVAGVAGAEQYNNTYPGYGPGIQGYGKRYGAALADSFDSRLFGSAILPTLFHQDPRYFYQGSGGIPSRAWHAAVSTVVTRGDNGKPQPNYSHILGSLIAGGIANAYHPESSRGIGLTFETLGITTAGNVIGNLFREFVLRHLVLSVPDYATGKK